MGGRWWRSDHSPVRGNQLGRSAGCVLVGLRTWREIFLQKDYINLLLPHVRRGFDSILLPFVFWANISRQGCIPARALPFPWWRNVLPPRFWRAGFRVGRCA